MSEWSFPLRKKQADALKSKGASSQNNPIKVEECDAFGNKLCEGGPSDGSTVAEDIRRKIRIEILRAEAEKSAASHANPAKSEEGCSSQDNTAKRELSESSPDDPIKTEDSDTSHDSTHKSEEGESPQKAPVKTKERDTPRKDLVKTKDSESSHQKPVNPIEYHPIEGRSFMIRSILGLILTLVGGELKFLEKPIPGGGAIWHCHKKNNWFGFCNSVSGTYLGHNGKGKIVATKSKHETDGYFVPIRQKSGGYVLYASHGEELLQVAISEDGKSLVEQPKGGTAWDFIDHSCYLDYKTSLTYPGMAVEKLR
ncbi:hypothetical protein V8C42DRAFT_360954 [Trichoderma barbatum]